MDRKPKNRKIESVKTDSAEQLGNLFARKLLHWNLKNNDRQMPWKGEKDPYKIWLSEIILQQTRVEQGLKYYQNFIKAFPTIDALAKAPEETVFKLWEGLGYYSRCRNLITTAKFISEELKGVFPSDFDSILQLKGVGNYTASAIASFAYNLPYAVLDGNVFRVLARIFGIETPIDSTKGKQQFSSLAQDLLPGPQAGEYNQAIMDFGATVCKPSPECCTCFFNRHCKAYLSGRQDLLPVKEKKIRIKERWFNYAIVRSQNEVLVHQRQTKDIWQQLFEFVLIETQQPESPETVLSLLKKQYGLSHLKFNGSYSSSQKLSHQKINFQLLVIETNNKKEIPGFHWITISNLKKYAFPRTLQEFVENELKSFD